MTLIVAAPVANRDWILPDWYRHLAAQTVKPDQVLLVHSGHRGDATWMTIADCASNYGLQTIRHHDPSTPHPRHDNGRFMTLAKLRNKMLAIASISFNHDLLLSLDTDILLEDPTTIEQLIAAREPKMSKYGFVPDVVAPLAHFHPDMPWTVNAGMLGLEGHHPQEALDAGRPVDLDTWPWKRAEIDPAYERAGVQPIDIPMGAILMPADVYRTVRYRWHEAGEDIGYGINLKLAGRTAGWIPSLQTRHVWDPSKL